MASGKKHDYDESKVKTLSSLEHIRLRTGMYIGRTGDGSHYDDGIYIVPTNDLPEIVVLANAIRSPLPIQLLIKFVAKSCSVHLSFLHYITDCNDLRFQLAHRHGHQIACLFADPDHADSQHLVPVGVCVQWPLLLSSRNAQPHNQESSNG